MIRAVSWKTPSYLLSMQRIMKNLVTGCKDEDPNNTSDVGYAKKGKS
jgi:hypothetical protein